MNNIQLKVENLRKTFGRRLVFQNISTVFQKDNIYGIIGKNGSGKSTFVKILAGIISPTNGIISIIINGEKVNEENLFNTIGFVSPYLVLYDEFSAKENLEMLIGIRGLQYNINLADYYFNEFDLFKRRNDLLKEYSSGMKQRVKLIASLIHNPKVLILDEPTSNLDEAGKKTLYKMIEQKSEECITIIASNEESDIKICSDTLNIEEFKN